MNLFGTLVRRRIGTQIAILMVTSILLAHGLTAAIFNFLGPQPSPWPNPHAASLARMVLLARLMDEEPDAARRGALLRSAQALNPQLRLLPQAPAPNARLTDSGMGRLLRADFGERMVLASAGDDQRVADADDLLASLALADGTALAIPLPFGPPPRIFSPLMIGTLVFLASAMALLSFWAARTLTSPLSRFAAAAEQFTLSGAQAPIAEDGPTEVRMLAHALNDMRTRIRHMVDERTRMLAAVSHDLRTPITRLRLRAEDIADPALRAAVLRDLAGMQALVQAALSFLRDETVRGELVRTDLPSLLQSICDDFGDLGRAVEFNGPDRLAVDCDPDQLRRAVTNVIENGLKFGEAVDVRLHGGPDGGAVIEVRDDGPGIPDTEKERVLEPFYRGDAARGGEGPASFGLGLTIARTIMDAHGGRLELIDAEPTGLIVRLTLPPARTSGAKRISTQSSS